MFSEVKNFNFSSKSCILKRLIFLLAGGINAIQKPAIVFLVSFSFYFMFDI